MKKKTFISIIAIAFLSLNLLATTHVLAQDAGSSAPYKVLAPLPCIESPATKYIDSKGQTQTNPGIKCEGGNGAIQTEVNFKTYVQYTFNLLIALSAVLAVVMIIWGGIEYMTHESFQKKSDGKKRIQDALLGLLLILTSYIILRTIDPRLVEIPNTLVPQIEVKDWLAKDRLSLLKDQLQDDIEAYNRARKDIGLEMQSVQDERIKNQKELDEIQAKIDKYYLPEGNDITETYDELMLKRSRLEQEAGMLRVKYQTSKSLSGFNGILDDATRILIDPSYTKSRLDVITSINDHVENKIVDINGLRKELLQMYDKTLIEYGSNFLYDHEHKKKLDNAYNFSDATLKLHTIRLSVVFAKENSARFFILPDGSKEGLSDKQMKTVLAKSVAEVDAIIEKINDPQLLEKIKLEREQVAGTINYR